MTHLQKYTLCGMGIVIYAFSYYTVPMKISRLLLQMFRFAIGGIPGALLYYGALYLFTYMGMWYVLAFTLAQLSNSGLNFIIQKQWVFEDNERKHIYRKIVLHILVSTLLLSISALLIYIVREYLHIPYLLIPIVLVIPKTLLAYSFARLIFKPYSQR